MAQAKSKVFIVTPRLQSSDQPDRTRLIRAERINQVQAFLLNELNIAPASQEDCLTAGKQGVEIQDAGEQAGE